MRFAHERGSGKASLRAIRAAAVAISLVHSPATLAQAQADGAARPRFEVASLKPGQPIPGDKIYINLGSLSHGTLTLTNTSLADCLRYAYGLTSNDQLAGPDWIKSKVVRFDIVAKAPPDTPLEQIRLMLQTLLTERFQLALHREQKELSYVALVIGKKGPKLREAIPDSDASGNKFLIGLIVSNHISMTTLATLFSRFTGQTVVDMTGLTGSYDLRVEWAPEHSPASTAPGRGADAGASTDGETGPSLFAAVEQQLGLKLEVRKGPVEIIAIDHAERVPAQN
ncbi:MAG: TIGR03435 family protein [Bryobacteraceae bacterium]|jgi:uncharacterized protein (TIGR03435 family)